MSDDNGPRPIDVVGRNVAALSDRVDSLTLQVTLLLLAVIALAGGLGGAIWRLRSRA